MTIPTTLEHAQSLDRQDPLRSLRQQFLFPRHPSGEDYLYFCGNSLGLQPKSCKDKVDFELSQWAAHAVEGHFQNPYPWYSYHELVTESMAKIVGALPSEVVAMNSLTTNLHLMMVSFFRPTNSRHKILMESSTFPSDFFAVKSQLKYHGFSPESDLLLLHPRPGEENLQEDDILEIIERRGREIALVMLSGVHFRTGQAFPLKRISEAARDKGCVVGFDLAHAAGNLKLELHDWHVDFAVWCTYKFLNAGPGGIGGCFIHQKHLADPKIPRFAGWWGHNKKTRFQMGENFDPIETAEGWQLSNPPIFQLASLRSSLEIFDQTNMDALVAKSRKLNSYLLDLIAQLWGPSWEKEISLLTPKEPSQRGCQLSLKIPTQHGSGEQFIEKLRQEKIIGDFRPPQILRITPAPLYNSFEDVWHLVHRITKVIKGTRPS